MVQPEKAFEKITVKDLLLYTIGDESINIFEKYEIM